MSTYHATSTAPREILVSAQDLKPGDLTPEGIVAEVSESSFLGQPAIRYTTTEGRAFLAQPLESITTLHIA